MKWVTRHKDLTFEIVKDLPEVGYYVYAFDSSGNCIRDDLQDDLDMAKRCAYDEFGVPYDSWNEASA